MVEHVRFVQAGQQGQRVCETLPGSTLLAAAYQQKPKVVVGKDEFPVQIHRAPQGLLRFAKAAQLLQNQSQVEVRYRVQGAFLDQFSAKGFGLSPGSGIR